MTAVEFEKTKRAIEIFEAYGLEVDSKSRDFEVRGNDGFLGVYETSDQLFTAACAYDVGRSHGFSEGVKEMESGEQESQ